MTSSGPSAQLASIDADALQAGGWARGFLHMKGRTALLLLGLFVLVTPTMWDLTHGVFAGYSQGHETMIMLVSAWLLYRRRAALLALPAPGRAWPWAVGLGLALLSFALTRSQEFIRLEMFSLVLVGFATLGLYKGRPGVQVAWFPLAFLLFAIPLPYEVLLGLTGPLKAAVSAAACGLLSWFGYPIGRDGVVITIGQYQLLVTEACTGLQSIFTLEAVGLVYTNLMNYRSWTRQLLLAVLVVPVSFLANVVRVVVLVLITHYLGDAAGRGFLHGFAGLMLFAVAFAMIYGIDKLLGRLLPARFRT